MTQEQLIVKQQLEIETYKELLDENAQIIDKLKMSFYAIGQPLNDNRLQFNDKQLVWCSNTLELIEEIQTGIDQE